MSYFQSIGSNLDGFHRILVVDDDAALLKLVKVSLERAGFEVLTATSGQQGLEVIKHQGLPHLAVVDLMMPEMNGFEFCENVQRFSDVPVIMLTAIDEEETVIQGLEHFAEDYIVKPFSLRELTARVQRVLRRMGDFSYTLAPLTRIDDNLAVDFVRQLLIINDRPVSLTPIQTKILYILMGNAGQMVSTDFLLRRLWPLEEASEQALRVHIHRLRQKIEFNQNQQQYIITERGVGYSFPKTVEERLL